MGKTGKTFFRLDASELKGHIKTAAKMFPKEAQKAVAQYLNDKGRLFKELGPKVLATRYKIRSKAFVNAAFKHEPAKASHPINAQVSQTYTRRIDRSQGKGKGGLFTGWEEEITGARREMRRSGSEYGRPIWSHARKGGSLDNMVDGKYRLRKPSGGHNSDIISDSRNYGMPIPQFLAMLSKSPKDKDGNKRIGKNQIFILEGGGFPLGLYRFKPDDVFKGTSHPEVQALQQFDERPPIAEKFDWQKMTIDRVNAWFSPNQVWDTYFAPILAKLWKK